MENQYGITITNKYDLFLRDQDPLEILQMQEDLKAARKSEKSKKSVTANDKDTKSAKNKQIKAAVVSQEQKVEKIESVTPLPKKEDKPRHPKPVKTEENAEIEPKVKDKQLNRASSAQQRSRDDAGSLSMNSGNRTEFGHFEVRPSDRGGNRERRPRDNFDRQDRGGGIGGSGGGVGNRDRPDRTEGRDRPDRGYGRERRPRGRFIGSRPPRRGGYSDDRPRGSFNGEDQERGLFTEGEPGGPAPRDQRGFSDGMGDKGGFCDQFENTGFKDSDRRPRGFDDQVGGGVNDQRNYEDRKDRGNFNERRTFESRRNVYGGERRNYEDRPDREGYVERKRSGGFGEQQDNQSFGHWSDKPGDGEDREIRRGRGGFGRRGRGRGRAGFPRREFDRRGGNDQSGARSGEKREGSGAHNWGTAMDDLEGQTETQPGTDGATWGDQAEAAEIQDAAGTSSGKPTDEKEAGAAAEEAAEDEQKVMTLDEWRALQSVKRVKPEYNIRKPGEGCNDPQWKKMFVLKKKITEEHSDEEEEGEYEEDRHGKSKNVLPIEITFADNPRRGGRGGRRGGGRGGGGGGSGGGGRGYASDHGGGLRGEMRKSPSRHSERDGGGRRGVRERAPNVADEHDFPSLDKAIPVQ